MPLMDILDVLRQPWPWYVAGPIVGLTVPLLLLVGNKHFGVSSNLRHACAILPTRVSFFRYDWKRLGGWNLAFAGGIVLGGLTGGVLLANPEPLQLSAATQSDLAALGINFDGNLVPAQLFGAEFLTQPIRLLFLLLAGALVGFGARWAGGCTSGHAITGLANLQLPSLIAVVGFFIGGLTVTHLLLPFLLKALL